MANPQMGRLVLCADDFAMSAGVSRTILKLARAGKLNATSCMAISPRWPDDAALLASLPQSIAIGLHLVLTDETPLTAMGRLAPSGRLPSADRLSRIAMLRRLPREEISAEVRAQFDRFEQAVGRPPSFVDGHQHAHFLPGIRDIVIAETARRAPAAWLRTCEDRVGRILRRPFRLKALVNAFQSAGVAREAARAGLRTNDSFSGLYDFEAPYAELFPQFVTGGGKFHLVICHPGDGESDGDPIAPARQREAAALRTLPVRELARDNGLEFGGN